MPLAAVGIILVCDRCWPIQDIAGPKFNGNFAPLTTHSNASILKQKNRGESARSCTASLNM